MDKPRASPLRRIAAAAALLPAIVLLTEIGLRLRAHLAWPADFRATLSEPGPPEPDRTRMADVLRASRDARILYELRPNLKTQYKGALLTTDEHGFIQRDETLSPSLSLSPSLTPALAPSLSPLRILAIGGSFLMPQGCPPGTDCVSRLVDRLRAQRPEQPWALQNASAPLQRLAMKVGWLEARAEELDPDLVLLGFGPVDLNLPSYLPAPPAALDLERSLLWDWLTGTRPALSFVKRERLAWHGDPAVPATDLPAAVRSFVGYAAGEAALDRLKRLVDRNGWELALVTNLELGEVPWVVEQARARGLHVFNGHAALLATLGREHGEPFSPEVYAHSKLVLSPAAPQPSAYQHEVLAIALEADLRERGVLSRLLGQSDRHRPPD